MGFLKSIMCLCLAAGALQIQLVYSGPGSRAEYKPLRKLGIPISVQETAGTNYSSDH